MLRTVKTYISDYGEFTAEELGQRGAELLDILEANTEEVFVNETTCEHCGAIHGNYIDYVYNDAAIKALEELNELCKQLYLERN